MSNTNFIKNYAWIKDILVFVLQKSGKIKESEKAQIVALLDKALETRDFYSLVKVAKNKGININTATGLILALFEKEKDLVAKIEASNGLERGFLFKFVSSNLKRLFSAKNNKESLEAIEQYNKDLDKYKLNNEVMGNMLKQAVVKIVAKRFTGKVKEMFGGMFS